jgi:hypothetical protein
MCRKPCGTRAVAASMLSTFAQKPARTGGTRKSAETVGDPEPVQTHRRVRSVACCPLSVGNDDAPGHVLANAPEPKVAIEVGTPVHPFAVQVGRTPACEYALLDLIRYQTEWRALNAGRP